MTSYIFGDRANMHDVVRHQRDLLDRTVAEIPENAMATQSTDSLVALVVEKLGVDVPVLKREGIFQLPAEEIDIDVSHDQNRAIIPGRGPAYVKGTEIKIGIPFSGDPQLLRFGTAPSGFGSSAVPGYVVDDYIVLAHQAEHPDEAKIKADFDGRMTQIEDTLRMARGNASEWNQQLPILAKTKIEARQKKLQSARGVSLGYPLITPKATPPDPVRQSRPPVPTATKRKPCDLFLSHASEDKESIARPLYEALTAAGYSVWFDEATLKMGDSLRQKIDEGLARSRYGIVILSPRFFAKRWPQRELDGLVAKETATGEKAILPIWHELNHQQVAEISPTLADRVAGNSSDGIAALVRGIKDVLG